MPESSIVVRPQPTDSASYTAGSRLQAAGLRPALAIFEEAAAVVPLPRAPQPIVIADYGASTAHNSLLPICAAIDVLRKRTRPDQSILVIHTDVPENDFTAMFRTLSEDPDTYLKRDSATFASAIGRSFYEQIMPTGSVHLAWSSWAIQWLSRVPGPIRDHVQVAYSADADARAAYARQAAHDWHEFIAFRGRELRRGGRLVVMTMAVDEDGQFGYRALFKCMLDTLDELRGQGLITEDEVQRVCIPLVARREEDFFAPFAPSGRFEQLQIDHLEVFNAEDRFWNQYQIDGDTKAFGAAWASFVRVAVLPTLTTALAGGRDDPRAGQFLDRLESGIAQRLAAAPEQMQIPLAHLVLIKRPKLG